MADEEKRTIAVSINVAVLAFLLTTAMIVGGWVWTASQMSANLRMLQAQQAEQREINKEITKTLQHLTNSLAVISSEHEKFVMPHVAGHQ